MPDEVVGDLAGGGAARDRGERQRLAALMRLLRPRSLTQADALDAGDTVVEASVFSSWVDQHLRELGLSRPEVSQETEVEDPRWLVWWLLRMAAADYARRVQASASLDPGRLAELQALLLRRPMRDEAYGQLHIDAASTLRRAAAVQTLIADHPGPVLAVGDDDGVTLALALLGVPELHVVDIDPRVLDFLAEAGELLGASIATARVDVFAQPVPESLRRRCAAVITDPLRSAEDGLPFLLFAAAALRRAPAGFLCFADHPDWSFDHALLLAALDRARLVPVRTLEDLHAYPLAPGLFLHLKQAAAAAGCDPDWLAELTQQVSAVAHLYVYRRG